VGGCASPTQHENCRLWRVSSRPAWPAVAGVYLEWDLISPQLCGASAVGTGCSIRNRRAP